MVLILVRKDTQPPTRIGSKQSVPAWVECCDGADRGHVLLALKSVKKTSTLVINLDFVTPVHVAYHKTVFLLGVPHRT